MMNAYTTVFLIEVDPDNRQMMFDFQLALVDSIGVQEFTYGNKYREFNIVHKFVNKTEALATVKHLVGQNFYRVIPCGSIAFSLMVLEHLGITKVKPINIPKELRTEEFVGRKIDYEVPLCKLNLKDNNVFIKDVSVFKGYSGLGKYIQLGHANPNSLYNISEIVEPESEWRVFIRKGEILDVVKYAGCWDCIPCKEAIRNMIDAYKSAPKSYTLDVMICGSRTLLVEVHDIFSCGTYGFDSPKLVSMYMDWFYPLLNG